MHSGFGQSCGTSRRDPLVPLPNPTRDSRPNKERQEPRRRPIPHERYREGQLSRPWSWKCVTQCKEVRERLVRDPVVRVYKELSMVDVAVQRT